MSRFIISLFALSVCLSACLFVSSCFQTEYGYQLVVPQEHVTFKKKSPGYSPPSEHDLEHWLRQFEAPNATVRETAIRRLLPHPQTASESTVDAFTTGNLSTRLAALELLKEWNAPVEELDPWQPDTFTPERLAALSDWQKEEATRPPGSAGFQPASRNEKTYANGAALPLAGKMPADPAGFQPALTEEQHEIAVDEIQRMLRGSDSEAEAIRERLARWGSLLLPLVYEQLKTITTDRERLRLQALRYRLVADESLAQRWPDGLLRLASPETTVRQKCAEELVALATHSDQTLLRELFSDPNPLVREICLRGMQKTGGETQEMLLDLLADPEPNVRAAVLKQLEENPGPGASAKITEYVKTEKDPDLVGHAVRVLRTLHKRRDANAARSLIELLKHERWQVRADAAEALGAEEIRSHGSLFGENRNLSTQEQLQVDIYVALIERLDDEDSFVVSKAVEGMKNMDMPSAVEPLVKVIEQHPDLAAHVISLLTESDQMRTRATPRLRSLAQHADPKVRSAVFGAVSDLGEKEIAAGIADSDSRVRIAATQALLKNFEQKRETMVQHEQISSVTLMPRSRSRSPSVVSGIAQLFGGSKSKKAKDNEKENVAEKKPDDLDMLQAEIASSASTVTPEVYDQWLTNFYQGKNRPGWTDKLRGPLEKMLSVESLEEQTVAAVALVPLGKADEMLPRLLKLVKEQPELFDSFIDVIPWLTREKRVALFRQWQQQQDDAAQDTQTARFLNRLADPPDLRNESLFWDALNKDDTSFDLADSIYDNMKPLYLIYRFSYNDGRPSAKIQTMLAGKLAARANSGSENQRLVAVALLVSVAPETARELAQKLDTDTGTAGVSPASRSEEFRLDMFQIQLLTQPDRKTRTEFAANTLKQKDPTRSRLAIQTLVSDSQSLQILRKRMYLYVPLGPQASSLPNAGRTSALQSVPKNLDLESLKPLTQDENEEIAAYAGYFTVLLGDASGLEPLLKFWRNTKDESEEPELVRTLLYRAIASLDDSRHIPVLREIYGKLDGSDVEDFYWTVRTMTGPEILKFRKEIRDKHGIGNLM